MNICWVDIGCHDPDAAAAFYGALFGWIYTEPDEDGYRIAHRDGRQVSGLGRAEDPGPPYWTVVLGVDDIHASAREFAAKGARFVVPPAQVGDRGHTAVAVDPVGARISLWQAGTLAGTRVTDFADITLSTDRPAEARAFYGDGLKTVDGPTFWLVSFTATAAAALSLGATRLTATTFRDPAGAIFGIREG